MTATKGFWPQMSMAAVLVARIRNRERVMANIMARNPETYRDNPYYTHLQSAVVAYRDALNHIERVTSSDVELIPA